MGGTRANLNNEKYMRPGRAVEVSYGCLDGGALQRTACHLRFSCLSLDDILMIYAVFNRTSIEDQIARCREDEVVAGIW